MLLILIPIGRLLISLNNWQYLEKAKRKHREYLDGIPKKASEEEKKKSKEAAGWLTSNLVEIKKKVAQAGVNDQQHKVMEPAGYGYLSEQTIGVLDNLLLHNKDILIQASHTLALAAGAFKTEAFQSINPIYWLEVLFFLPKWLVSASGIEVTSKVADIGLKVVQVLYWLVIVVTMVLKPELVGEIFLNK